MVVTRTRLITEADAVDATAEIFAVVRFADGSCLTATHAGQGTWEPLDTTTCGEAEGAYHQNSQPVNVAVLSASSHPPGPSTQSVVCWLDDDGMRLDDI